jgi:serine/threonine protein kinase
VSEYNGWQKLERIGGGGQSEVYLSRSPKRAKERQDLLSSTQSANGLGSDGQFADAVIAYGRPDHLNELGALKVFKIRESGALPLERLKREIAILAEGRPNLPRLLDSNADELWMITEFFPNRTLAETPVRYKGKPLEALQAFRGLVETVSTLHNDGVVHRDIKPANVFISLDGRLIPGDFGLVFHSSNQNRLTLSNERVGPSEHLPWWANIGVRLDNPTPAIDVFLLGSLLWCMVSGDRWLHGERYRTDHYNLEKRFRGDRSVRWVNLVLSQCLGDDEGKCVKNASEVLDVVDEVIATITKGTPIFDEDNVLVMPCRFCETGFYHGVVERKSRPRAVVQTANEQGQISSPLSFNVIQCNVCSNTQFFLPSQPFEALKQASRGRVNPQLGTRVG